MESKTKVIIDKLIEMGDSIKERLPYITTVEVVDNIKNNSGLKDGIINYPMIEMFKVIGITQAFLGVNNIEYELPKFEDVEDGENDINVFAMYDELIEIYDKYVPFNTACVIEELISKEIKLAENKHISKGQFESQILDIATQFVKSFERLSLVINDKKKLNGVLKEFTKNFHELKDMANTKE